MVVEIDFTRATEGEAKMYMGSKDKPVPRPMDCLERAMRRKSEGVVLWIRGGAYYRGPTVDSVNRVLKPEDAARARTFGTRLDSRGQSAAEGRTR